jgi:hypothetical protein
MFIGTQCSLFGNQFKASVKVSVSALQLSGSIGIGIADTFFE